MSPVGVIGYANVFDRHGRAMRSRYGESLRTIGCGNDHAVAVGLLDEVLVLLYEARLAAL